MDLGFIKNVLQQYAGNPRANEDSAHEHFDAVSRSVESSTLAQGISAALRSDQTPPFAQMVSQLFSSASSEQKAGMLNTLISGLSPAILSQFSRFLPHATNSLTPAQAEAIPAEAVQQMAQHAEQQDPSIVDRLSSIYAEHPTLVKTLGAAAMIIALRKIAERYP
jgi:hypothetical protein